LRGRNGRGGACKGFWVKKKEIDVRGTPNEEASFILRRLKEINRHCVRGDPGRSIKSYVRASGRVLGRKESRKKGILMKAKG